MLLASGPCAGRAIYGTDTTSDTLIGIANDLSVHHGRRSYNDCFGSGRITKRKVCDILRYKPYISLIALRSSV